MPPRSRPPPPPHPSSHPSSHGSRKHKRGHDLALDAGAIDAALVEIVPDARDRAFVIRCVLEEGPRHHRVASWALLRMLAATLAEVGGADPATREGPTAALAMRLPPHVAKSADGATFPIGVPTRMLGEVLEEDEAALAIEGMSDGPPHHALANAVMAWMVEAIHARVRGRPSPARGTLRRSVDER